MTTYATRQSTRDQHAKPDPPGDVNSELNMATIASLLEEHRQALSADFKTAVSALDEKLDNIHARVTVHAQKITSLESNANLQDECLLALEKTCTTLSEINAKLLAKVSDLESRSRRNNIRLIRIPESAEGPNPTSFFSELLVEAFGDYFLKET